MTLCLQSNPMSKRRQKRDIFHLFLKINVIKKFWVSVCNAYQKQIGNWGSVYLLSNRGLIMTQRALYVQCRYIVRTVGTMYVQCTYIVRTVPAGDEKV